jgi:SAM-dependent methyltransferase
VRTVDDTAIRAAANTRFRSEYDYAVFEYLRSAKVIRALERAGVKAGGRILDAGCGGGGTAVSLAEEADLTVGLDIEGRFADAGTRLARERDVKNVAFLQGDGVHLPFGDATFDLVFSHSVIEHVHSAREYLAECRRVLVSGGHLYLSTAPYLSIAGSHFPRLRVPLPIHLVLPRRLAFRFFSWLGRRAPWTLSEGREGTSFVASAERGETKHDDLLQRITVRRLGSWIAETGLVSVSEERYVTGFFRRGLPPPLRRLLEQTPWAQDVMIGQIQCVFRKP